MASTITPSDYSLRSLGTDEGMTEREEEGPFLLEVDYSTEVDYDSYPVLEGDQFQEFTPSELEIDIFPDNDIARSLNLKLERENQELKMERDELRNRVHDLEVEVAELNSHATNVAVPTLYVQLNATRKCVAELEKKNQELETEIEELTSKLDKKDQDKEQQSDKSHVQRAPTSNWKPPTIRRSYTTPFTRGPSEKSTSHRPGQTDEIIMTKGKSEKKGIQQREMVVNRLEALGAGIDGLELRLHHLLTALEANVAQKFKNLLVGVQSLQKTGSSLEMDASRLQSGINDLLQCFECEIRDLNDQWKNIHCKRDVHVCELEEALEMKSRNLEESKKQILSLSDDNKRQSNYMTELENTIEELQFQIASMKTQRLVPDGMQPATSYRELDAMMARISQLETSLKDQQLMNEALLRERREAEDIEFAVTKVEDIQTVDALVKENKELRNELMEVSEKLVDTEDQNDTLRDDLENQADFFGQCLHLEEEIQAQKRVNRGLTEQLARKKKRIDCLQDELGNLRQQLGDMESGHRHSRRNKGNTAIVSTHVEDMLQHEQRYEELERVLSGVQDERDGLLQDKAASNKMIHSLIKENKLAIQELNKLKDEGPAVKERLDKARAEITKLKAQLKAETLARQHSIKNSALAEVDEDIMSKLVTSQISMAETEERLIKLRKELHKSVARNMYLASKLSRLERQKGQ